MADGRVVYVATEYIVGSELQMGKFGFRVDSPFDLFSLVKAPQASKCLVCMACRTSDPTSGKSILSSLQSHSWFWCASW